MEVFSLCPNFPAMFNYILFLHNSTNEVWKIDELLNTIKTKIGVGEASEGSKLSGVENRKPPINP